MKNRIFTLLGLLILLCSCQKDESFVPLKANFTVPSQQVLAGESISFTDVSEGQPSSWSWEFEGGTPAKSDLSAPVVTYDQPGTYSVSLEIKNSRTASIEKKTGYITVDYRDVEADFTASSTTIMQDESIKFTDKSSGMPNKWEWEFKSGTTIITSAEQSPSIKFSVPGVYSVTLVVTNPKGSHNVVRAELITVVDVTSIEADFDSDQPATYTGGSIKFSDKSVGTATTWNWTFEGASVTTSNIQNPIVIYPNPGRYKVKLVAANSVRSSTIEKAGYIMVVPGGSLTAFYPMDGSINDAGPSKLISTAVGTVTFDGTDRTSAAGRAGAFNGTGGFFVPDNDAMNFGTGDYSVSCWMKTSTTVRGMIWQESGAKGSGDNQTWLRILGSATNLTSFSTEDPTGGSTINLTTAANGSVATTNDGKWHHIVCVRQGAVTALYIDGAKIKEATSPTGVKTTSNNAAFKVGMQEGTAGYSNPFNGQIDDLIIYKKALSQAEITVLKNL